jgi:hypothetical protein
MTDENNTDDLFDSLMALIEIAEAMEREQDNVDSTPELDPVA